MVRGIFRRLSSPYSHRILRQDLKGKSLRVNSNDGLNAECSRKFDINWKGKRKGREGKKEKSGNRTAGS